MTQSQPSIIENLRADTMEIQILTDCTIGKPSITPAPTTKKAIPQILRDGSYFFMKE